MKPCRSLRTSSCIYEFGTSATDPRISPINLLGRSTMPATASCPLEQLNYTDGAVQRSTVDAKPADVHLHEAKAIQLL